MEKNSKIYVAGHRGMVGSAIVRKPEYVFLAAAKVGGIVANSTYGADFIYNNLIIQTNVINAAHTNGVKKLLFLGSSCIYPRQSPQPIKEEYLMTGLLEPTNEPYAIAKIAGLKMCDAFRSQYGCNFISVMPTNLFGPNDNYDLQNSHVLPGLLRKMIVAKTNADPYVNVWGTGNPRREFLHVDDLADACVFLMQTYNNPGWINIGVGEDVSIKELAEIIKDVVGYEGEIAFESDKPDGTPRKLLDVSLINSLGWKSKIELREGIESVYNEVKSMF